MASNTEILIKRSSVTSKPPTLKSGELAYSYLSNTLFFGTAGGNGTVNVGGQYYTSTLDAATSANTSGALVRRDVNGAFFGRLYGNANTADAWNTARYIGVSGEATGVVSVDGTANANIPFVLTNTGVAAGQYGSSTSVPTITVAANGRVLSVTTNSISTLLNISADVGGTSNVYLLNQTLGIAGGVGITSTVSGQTITLDVDNTVFRANTSVGKQLIAGDVAISGNLSIIGNVTSIDVTSFNVSDPLIYLAGNNHTSDIVDIGFIGNYFDGADQRHAGIIRHAGNKDFYVFDNYNGEHTTNVIDVANASFRLATLHTNLTANTANAGTLFVSNKVYGDTTNNTLFLIPSLNYGPGKNDQYVIIDPTAPNHIHLRPGGAIDSSNADIYLGGEKTNVQVSDGEKKTYIRANNYTWTFKPDGDLSAPGKIIANQSTGTVGGGFTFQNDGGYDSGMFSPTNGEVHFYSNNQDAAEFTTSYFKIKKTPYLTSINHGETLNLVYINVSTGELTYAAAADINPDEIANGAYRMFITNINGLVKTNGAGIELANGAILKDTTTNAVAFGKYAGAISQGSYSVAIGDSAGYNTQGLNAVAIGYSAGNITQGNYSIAVGDNAGQTNQGTYSASLGHYAGNSGQGTQAVAIGDHAASLNQGAYAIAVGANAGGNGSAQGTGAIAVGYNSGWGANNYSVALGFQAGAADDYALGNYAIAIGYKAGFASGSDNSIVLNASGSALNATQSGLYINPIRYAATQDTVDDGIVFFNQTTKEVRYSYALDGGSF